MYLKEHFNLKAVSVTNLIKVRTDDIFVIVNISDEPDSILYWQFPKLIQLNSLIFLI